jgi:hypothetical protein
MTKKACVAMIGLLTSMMSMCNSSCNRREPKVDRWTRRGWSVLEDIRVRSLNCGTANPSELDGVRYDMLNIPPEHVECRLGILVICRNSRLTALIQPMQGYDAVHVLWKDGTIEMIPPSRLVWKD